MRRPDPSEEARPPDSNTTAPPAAKPSQNGGAFRALRNKNYRLYWIAQLVSLTGTWMQNLAQGWLILLLVDPMGRQLLAHGGAGVGHASHVHTKAAEAAANLYSGWVNFAGGIPTILLTLIAGVVADRVDKRRLLVITQSVLAGTAFGVGILIATGKIEIWHVLFFAFLSGIAVSFDMPTRQAFQVEMVGREDLPSAVALGSSMFNSARTLGPALAGLLIAANMSLGTLFLSNGFMTLGVIVVLAMIRPAFSPPIQPGGPRTPRQIWHNMREGFRYVRGHQTVGNLVFLTGMFGMFAMSYNVLIPVFVRYTLVPHVTDAQQVRVFGILESVRGIGALGGALTVAFLGTARRQRNMLIGGSLLGTAILFAFAASRTLWLAYTTMAIASYAFILCFATSNTLMQLTVPDALRGRVMSIYTLMFIGTMPIGSLMAGTLARYIGSPDTICVFAAISLASALIVSFRPGGLRDLEAAVTHHAAGS